MGELNRRSLPFCRRFTASAVLRMCPRPPQGARKMAELLMKSAIAKLVAAVPYRQSKHLLFGQQAGWGYGCRNEFPCRVLEVDYIIPCGGGGGQDNIENLQLCAPISTR